MQYILQVRVATFSSLSEAAELVRLLVTEHASTASAELCREVLESETTHEQFLVRLPGANVRHVISV